MVSFLATLKVAADRREAFEQYCRELVALTREHEPGTLVYELVRSQDDPLTYLWYARFVDRAAFDAHQTSAFHDRIVPPLLACLAQEMDLQFYDYVD